MISLTGCTIAATVGESWKKRMEYRFPVRLTVIIPEAHAMKYSGKRTLWRKPFLRP